MRLLGVATLMLGVLHMAAAPARAAALLVENFDDVTALAGWTLTNNSTAGGSTNWFQGNAGIFPAQSGPANSYIAANFENAALGGAISNWLILPTLAFNDGDTLSFFTRSNGVFPDRLEVRFSANGASGDVGGTPASVGDFTTLLQTVNPSLAPGGYPSDWTQFVVTLSGLGGQTNGRLAFRYAIDDTNVNGDYIGIDTVAVNHDVPEPGTLAIVGLGLAGLAARRRRRVVAPAHVQKREE